ncbi:ABC transporter permease [Candidatus Woesearchaeota archaeon]|nr:ABC transporter permease [Candidatus Woesearchaeota archaeon]
MKFIKAFKYAFNMVMHSRLRSWLTILGIVIGVAAVISIVSIGNALKSEVTSQLGQLGGDLLTLRAGASRAGGFAGPGGFDSGGSASASKEEIVIDKTDVQVLKGISGIKLIATEISGRADAYYVAEKGSTTVTGVDPAVWSQITTSTIRDGRMLGPADTNVIVVGGRFADSFFSKQLGVNHMVTIEDRLFRIVGILDDSSSNIYMPITQAYTVLTDKTKDVYDQVIIKVKDEDELNQTMDDINYKLKIARHVISGKLDFTLTSNKERQAQRTSMLASLTTFLTAIAAVALLVGAVGVANTMFTSVLEKTKEIGIMKAIGARNKDIMIIFLLNAALIGLIGGIIGIIIGTLLSGILPSIISGTGGMFGRFGSLGSIVSLSSVLMAIGISLIIGMGAGAIPAYQASKLKPVDALRYE